MVSFARIQYKEEGVHVASLLVTVRDLQHAIDEDANGWPRLIPKLPLTFFVRNPKQQFYVTSVELFEPSVPSDTIRISLVK
jgi:hypothetical protein